MGNRYDLLIDVLEKRTSLFEGIRAISRRQLEFCRREDLDPENWSGFLQLISQRQALMDEIDLLNSSLESGQGADGLLTAAADGMDSGYRYSEHNKELKRVMEAISKTDEACLKLLKGKSGELAMRIKETRVNRRAADAYTQANSINEAWFVDKKK